MDGNGGKKMYSSKNILSKWMLSLLAIAMIIFFGCGEKKVIQKDVKRITFMIWGSAEEKRQMDGWLTGFQEENPDIEVKCILVGLNYTQKVLMMFAGGTPPDVMIVGTGLGNIIVYAEKGILKPLDEFISTEVKRDIEPLAFECFKWQGSYYGIPREINGTVLYYNKDLFDRESLPYPDETWDWEKTVQIAKKLTKKEKGRIRQYGILNIPWIPTCCSYGAEMFNERGEFVFGCQGNKGAIKGTQLILRAIEEKAMPNSIAGTTNFGREEAAFLTGRIGMYIGGPWCCMKFAQRGTKFCWDMALVPKGVRRVTFPYVVGYAISKHTKYPDACWKLVRYLTSAEVSKDFAYSGRAFPSCIKAREAYLADSLYKSIEHKDIPEKSLKYEKVLMKNPKSREISMIMGQWKERMILVKDIGVEEGLRKTNKEVNKLLKMHE